MKPRDTIDMGKLKDGDEDDNLGSVCLKIFQLFMSFTIIIVGFEKMLKNEFYFVYCTSCTIFNIYHYLVFVLCHIYIVIFLIFALCSKLFS